jgi:hypothetical protein
MRCSDGADVASLRLTISERDTLAAFASRSICASIGSGSVTENVRIGSP